MIQSTLPALDTVMRRFYFPPGFLLLLAAMAMPVAAQQPASSPDDRPPALIPLDEGIEPQVTIRQQDGGTIEEYRVNGRLYKIKVTPQRGEPYILIDRRGDGAFVRHAGPGAPELSVPMWVIGTF